MATKEQAQAALVFARSELERYRRKHNDWNGDPDTPAGALRLYRERIAVYETIEAALLAQSAPFVDMDKMPEEIRVWGDGTWKDASCDNAMVANMTKAYVQKPAAPVDADSVVKKYPPESYEQRVLDSIAHIRGELEKGFYCPDKEPLEVIIYAAEESLK